MKSHQKTIGKNDEWLTPISVIQSLGEFDVDLCSCEKAWRNGYYGASIKVAYWKDGLSIRLLESDRVWMNPPFNRYERPR